jgi:hypothetical protein
MSTSVAREWEVMNWGQNAQYLKSQLAKGSRPIRSPKLSLEKHEIYMEVFVNIFSQSH